MHIKHLHCYVCGKQYHPHALKYRCECGGGLEIIYEYDKLRHFVSWERLRARPFNHWRYEELFPFVQSRVTFGEGGTPLFSLRGNPNVMVKLESANPTGSFKDRGSTIEISHAFDEGAKHVVCASTGNMGASVAAYCARAGLDCEIVLPAKTGGEKMKQISQYGAKTLCVKGDYAEAAQVAYNKYHLEGDFLVGDYAYRGEGEKSVAFEIMDQLCGQAPDYIIVPIGNGTLISGMWKGLKEMKKLGLIEQLPRLIGVQAAGCNTVVKAFLEGKKIKHVKPDTIAGAVACGKPLDGVTALRALKESGGEAIALTDKDILHARSILAVTEGVDAEPSGALAFGAYHRMQIPPSKKVVLVVTGHGLKDLEHV